MKNEKIVTLAILCAVFYRGFSLEIHGRLSDVSVKDDSPYVSKPAIPGSNGKYFEGADCNDCSVKYTHINHEIKASPPEIGETKITTATGEIGKPGGNGDMDILEGTTETLSPVDRKTFDSSGRKIIHRMHRAPPAGALGKYFLLINCTSCKIESEMVVKGKPDGGNSTGETGETTQGTGKTGPSEEAEGTGETKHLEKIEGTGETETSEEAEGTWEIETSEESAETETLEEAEGTGETETSEQAEEANGATEKTTEKMKVRRGSHQLKRRDTQYVSEPPEPGNIGKYFVYVNCKSCNVKNKLVTNEAPETSSRKEEGGTTEATEETGKGKKKGKGTTTSGGEKGTTTSGGKKGTTPSGLKTTSKTKTTGGKKTKGTSPKTKTTGGEKTKGTSPESKTTGGEKTKGTSPKTKTTKSTSVATTTKESKVFRRWANPFLQGVSQFAKCTSCTKTSARDTRQTDLEMKVEKSEKPQTDGAEVPGETGQTELQRVPREAEELEEVDKKEAPESNKQMLAPKKKIRRAQSEDDEDKPSVNEIKEESTSKKSPGKLGKFFVYLNCSTCKVRSELVIKGKKVNETISEFTDSEQFRKTDYIDDGGKESTDEATVSIESITEESTDNSDESDECEEDDDMETGSDEAVSNTGSSAEEESEESNNDSATVSITVTPESLLSEDEVWKRHF